MLHHAIRWNIDATRFTSARSILCGGVSTLPFLFLNLRALLMAITKNKVPWYKKALIILSMMSLMGSTLTGVMTYITIGYSDNFYHQWMSSFLLATFCLMPFGHILMGKVSEAVKYRWPTLTELKKSLVVGVFMAVIMETLMAFITAANNLGFSNKLDFFQGWLNGFLTALPVGLILMILISLTVKPRIDAILQS